MSWKQLPQWRYFSRAALASQPSSDVQVRSPNHKQLYNPTGSSIKMLHTQPLRLGYTNSFKTLAFTTFSVSVDIGQCFHSSYPSFNNSNPKKLGLVKWPFKQHQGGCGGQQPPRACGPIHAENPIRQPKVRGRAKGP